MKLGLERLLYVGEGGRGLILFEALWVIYLFHLLTSNFLDLCAALILKNILIKQRGLSAFMPLFGLIISQIGITILK